MVRTLERVLAHAAKELASQGQTKQNELVPLYLRFLKIENHRLRIRHRAGGGGLEIAQSRTALLDIVLRHLFKGATEFASKQGGVEVKRLAVVAIGGYGRGELNPYSDVDIMFLHNGTAANIPLFVKDVVTQVLYLLWDVGFKVGHSTRTISAAISHANEDMLSKTSLLESRLITGDKSLFDDFRKEFSARCVRGRGQAAAYIRWRLQNQRERHAKFGNTVFLQEPHIKNGLGGLRDYHNLMWMAYFKVGISSTRELVKRRFMSESERRAVKKAYDFLLRVRTELHDLHGRATDTLTLFYQGQIAERFRYPGKNVVLKSEAFMRDYFQNARAIYLVTDAVGGRLSLPEPKEPAQTPKIFNFLARTQKGREEFDAFYSHNGLIYFTRRELFNEDPLRLMRLFLYAQQRQLALSPELQQLIRRRLGLVDKTFRYSRAARDTLLEILSHKGQVGRVLRMMHEVDLLGRYLPEFGALTCLVQHEFFHRYTADEHTLVCIEKLDQVIDSEDPKRQRYRDIFQRLDNPEVLYLALLLHDVGKAGQQRSHAEAGANLAFRVCRRLGLPAERRRQVVLLVDNHILLSQTAQTRNLEELSTIQTFAAAIQKPENLDMLLLLTLADAQGTTGSAWSDWKESLALHLFDRTRRFYETDGNDLLPERNEIEETKSQVVRKLTKDFSDEIEAHFQLMPRRYFNIYEPQEISEHIRLFRQFIAMRHDDPELWLGAATRWTPRPDQGHSQVSLVTWDRQALFERIAGSFAVAKVNILSADIYTRGDDLVLDLFRVCSTSFEAITSPRVISQVENTLRDSLRVEDFDFAPMIDKARKSSQLKDHVGLDFPTRIAVINDLSPHFTVVEVRTPDRLGLLYDLLQGLGRMNVNIELSRISTEKGAAIDTFYLTESTGRKIEDAAAIRELQQSLRDAAIGQADTDAANRT